MAEERLQLAVLGQFKRGKSTLLNALLGAELLPAGVIPLTSIPTFISWGPKPAIRVGRLSGVATDEGSPITPDQVRESLFQFVAEKANPGNRLGIERVELRYPASILEDGVVLIDTPGIGSTLRHNTDAALRVLPECDAALFVLSTDPPITEAELAYLEAIKPRVSRLFFVLNKTDYLRPQDLEVAVAFLREMIPDDVRALSDGSIFATSALAGLRAKLAHDDAALEASGIPRVESHLLRYLAIEKRTALATAIRLKCSTAVAEAIVDLSLRIRALELPLQDLRQRCATLEQALTRIDAEIQVTRDLLAGDRRRAIGRLEEHAERLRQKGRLRLKTVLDEVAGRAPRDDFETLARDALTKAIPIFFEGELAGTGRDFGHAVEEIVAAHQGRVGELLNLVRRTVAQLFDIPYATAPMTEGFAFRRQPYWVADRWDEGLLGYSVGIVEPLLPRSVRRKRIRRRLDDMAALLVQRNVENLRWAALQALNDTFRRLEAALDQQLAETMEATRGAVRAVAARRAEMGASDELEVNRLREIAELLGSLKEELDADAAAAAPGIHSAESANRLQQAADPREPLSSRSSGV